MATFIARYLQLFRSKAAFLPYAGNVPLFVLAMTMSAMQPAQAGIDCARIVRADVVAIDQPLMFNRLGAQNVNGMIFALKRDVVDDSPESIPLSMRLAPGVPGHVFLRPDKRPRPLALRVAAGDCLHVTFTNLLTTASNPRHDGTLPFAPPSADHPQAPTPDGGMQKVKPFGIVKDDGQWSGVDDQVADRMVGFHVQGMQLVDGIDDDSSMVGKNQISLIAPGQHKTYKLYAQNEGTFLVTSHGATFGGDATAGNSANGLFGAVNVEPAKAHIYRSQVTDEEMRLASSTDANHVGGRVKQNVTADGQPIVDYRAVYPDEGVWKKEGKGGLPILNMVKGDEVDQATEFEIVHSDINAIIAGPDTDGSWSSLCPASGETPPQDPGQRKEYDDKHAACPYPLEKVGRNNPSLPKRLEAFREFTVIFHDEMSKQNAFQKWYDPVIDPNLPGMNKLNPLAHTLKAVGDVFMINYGSGGIGSEMLANRLHVGPMHDCLGCSAEEFFLTSHAVGDPAMVVDIPANFGMEECWPKADVNGKDPTDPQKCGAQGPKATKAYYPDDPSNVHHSYINDHVKFRNLHTGKEHHIFHLHNHQWLYNPNDDNSNYLDAQAIGPGSGYTYEINFGGSGNRNKSAGDAIFHCHLYPHFAQGMWELWRNHDVMETGTPLQVSGAADKFHSKHFGLQDGMPLQLALATHARALPDGEIAAGTPIPAVVPLPGKAMAPMPGKVTVVAKEQQVDQHYFDPGPNPPPATKVPAGSVAKVDRTDTRKSLSNKDEEANELKAEQVSTPLGNALNPKHLKNPGFPFWIAGIEHSVGQRPPTPPLDMMPKEDQSQPLHSNKRWADGGWDGGLPRHTLDGIAIAKKELQSPNTPDDEKDDKIPDDVAAVNNTRLDLSKRVKLAKPIWYPEDGTELEKVAMSFHAKPYHDSWTTNQIGQTTKDKFVTNGSGRPVAGAPFHEPCMDDKRQLMKKDHPGEFFDGRGGLGTTGSSPFDAESPRVYKGADIQFDAVLNKAGWHFPQERIIALWEDAMPIIVKAKAPEPLVMRNNTFDCTMFLHTNLVPETYELDDFEVRTSTDIIGQHIHLPKWDLTTTDGSGNGWNYEDGTLAPGAVRERIAAINAYYYTQKKKNPPTKEEPLLDVDGGKVYLSKRLIEKTFPIVLKRKLDDHELAPEVHPFFPEAFPYVQRNQYWVGARTTLQRWFFDPVVNVEGTHRGLGIIFTHDHFGPSTHQQVGLYATVLVEPAGSKWTHNETDELLYDTSKRKDGGPTSWQAMIKTGQADGYKVDGKDATSDIDKDGEDDSFREFYLEYSDFQHAYLPGKYVGADHNGAITGREEKRLGGNKLAFIASTATQSDPDAKAPDPYAPDDESYKFAINPPVKDYGLAADLSGTVLATYKSSCPPDIDTGAGVEIPRPCPEAITADDPGTFVVNYRNEPIGLRIQDTSTGKQASGPAGDLAYALQTFGKHRHLDEGKIPAGRAYKVFHATFGKQEKDSKGHETGRHSVMDAQPRGGDRIGFNAQSPVGDRSTCFPAVLQPRPGSGDPKVCQPCESEDSNGDGSAKSNAKKADPFTPMMRAYYGDRIRIKVQAGGDEETHNVTVHGLKWLQAGSGFGFAPNSGWRNSQQAGISEQFTFAATLPPPPRTPNEPSDRNFTNSLDEAKKVEDATKAKGGKLDADSKEAETLDERDVRDRKRTDFLYAVDASTEGYWNGTWGLIRAYEKWRDNLKPLPNNPYNEFVAAKFGDDDDKKHDKKRKLVCDVNDQGNRKQLRHFDVAAVLANDVLDNAVDAKYVSGADWSAYKLPKTDPIPNSTERKFHGTLVYNPRKTEIASVNVPPDPADGAGGNTTTAHLNGILHDPTAIMYVRVQDLDLRPNHPGACEKNGALDPEMIGDRCPAENLRIKASAPVEPLVLRAAAGDCIDVDLYNWVDKNGAPDMKTYRALAPIIPSNPENPTGSVFNANDVHTSNVIGLHPALVAYDVTQADGAAVGMNDDERNVVDPRHPRKVELGRSPLKIHYEWYAGDVSLKPKGALVKDVPREYDFVHTPIEFGGVSLMPADKIKQGQKGLVGALVIEPEGAEWNDGCAGAIKDDCKLDEVDDHQGGSGKRFTRLSATVIKSDGTHFRDIVTVMQKGLTQYYGDGLPVEGIAAEGVMTEDTEDGGGMAINYGSEPLWFRFGLPPNLPFTGTKSLSQIASFRDVPNAHEAYSNSLIPWLNRDALAPPPAADQPEPAAGCSFPPCANGEPAVPVLTAAPGEEVRMRVVMPSGSARGSVFNLHGHVWQRAPYICPGSSYFGMKNVCPNTSAIITGKEREGGLPAHEIGSRAIGFDPLSMYLGGQDSVLPASHFDIVARGAGGMNGVEGDYLYKDQASFGNLGGLWGILRVERPKPKN